MVDIDGFQDYLIEEELSNNTIKTYVTQLRFFSNKYDEITKKNVVDWKNNSLNEVSAKTVNVRLTAIDKYCKYKGIPVTVKRVKVQKMMNCENVITQEQYINLVNGLKADGRYRLLIIVLLMAKTGGRISEVLRYKKADLIRGHIELKTKGKVRTIYFPKKLVEEILSYTQELGEDDYLCRNRYGNQITSRGVDSQLKASAKKYGIPQEKCHPHAFRHFFAIEFLKRNKYILAG